MSEREKTCGLHKAEMEIKQHPHHTELYNHLLTHMLISLPMTHKSSSLRAHGGHHAGPIRNAQNYIRFIID